MGKILLVEDNPSAVKRLRQYINNIDTGLEVVDFAEAGEAYAFARKEQVDLFILDIQLADYKGTSLAVQLRALPEYKYTPIIFETALAGEELSAYREIKCYSFLVKPFREAEFRQAFCDAMGLSQRIGKPARTVQIEQKQFILEYKAEDIAYVEAFGKKLVIHTSSPGMGEKEDTISGYTLAGMLALIGEDSFLQCHKSYLVNRDHIERIDKTNQMIFLRGEEGTIPIGNKYRDGLSALLGRGV